jgi:tetratricopeptide (TPR) repeat protein
MSKIRGLRANLKLLIPLTIASLLIIAIFLNTPMSSSPDPLSLGVEGGQYTLTSIGRNNESMTHFVEDREQEARDVLKAALASLESGRTKLTAAGNTEDEYVLRMVESYQILVQASEVMAKGVENLLSISDDLESALNHYWRKEYEEASQKASVCLPTLTPLISDFEKWNQTLDNLNYQYIASGHREQTRQAVQEYRSAIETYLQYILLLRSLLEGVDYLEMRQLIDEYLKQLQSAIARGDHEAAQELLEEISKILQSLKDQNYQNAAATASQLDPNALSGEASERAQDLKTRLKSKEGIDDFERYLESLDKYLEALGYLEQGNLQSAEQAVNEGLSILGQGPGIGLGQGDSELKNLYEGLAEAFNSLLMRIRGQPDQG